MKQVYKDRTGIWRGVGDRNTVRHDSAFQDESLSARTSHVGTATGCFILNNRARDCLIIAVDNLCILCFEMCGGNTGVCGNDFQVFIGLADQGSIWLHLALHVFPIY